MSQFVGSFLAFKADEEYVSETEILVELTEVSGRKVELAFDPPITGKPRIYLRLDLAELLAHVMEQKDGA